jgi:signal transduction histidine kinase/DNA-binding NarL/FixJ family response regulator
MLDATNSRILVIDDEEVVRDSIRLILTAKRAKNHGLEAFAAELFDEPAPILQAASGLLEFTVDEAPTGRDGLELVRSAVAAGRPYAAIFVDMRMPGWDGIETVQQIRRLDRQAEVVFVTAYSDNSIEEIVECAGPNVGYHLKPFAPEEIKQIATKAVYDWNKLRRLERLVDLIGTLKVNATELNALLDHVFHQVTDWVGTDSAILAHRQENGQFEQLLATGSLRQEAVAAECLELLSQRTYAPLGQDFVCFRLERYDLVVLLHRSKRLNSEKLYLLELFVRHAGQAIENLRLHEALVRGEKLAAVGLAIGKVAHDLRSPIGAIQGAVNLLRESPADSELLNEMLGVISDSSEEAFSLAAELLAFTRNSLAHLGSVTTEDLFQALHQRLRGKLDLLGISLRLESENVETFVADAKKLQRALVNLLQNAAEALESSGTPQPSILLRLTRELENVRIEVIDNGPGIPVSLRSTLFEPFTTQGKAGGTGLGLAIVRQIAEAHGGSVTVTSSETGTCFSLLLPQRPPAQLTPEAADVGTLSSV